MRSSGNSRASLMAAMAIAMMGAGIALPQPHPQRNQPDPPRPRRVLTSGNRSALQREIDAHNEAVERRKAEKQAAKRARRLGVA